MAPQFSTQHLLPPLTNGRRYSHELRDPKLIPVHIRFDVLQLLRKYHAEVCLSVPTLSEASGTSAPAHSEASTGTSITEMTFAFSADNGSVQREPARKPLPDVQRARKALLRKLQACREDCSKRKVKCQLWHHSLRDLLEIEHEAHDEAIVEWAIRYDAESQTPVATTPISARVSTFAAGGEIEERDDVVDQANGIFDLPPGIPMPYGSGIQETTASLLDNSEGVSPQSLTRGDTIVAAVPVPYIYSTIKNRHMFPLGSREGVFGLAQYRCEFPECGRILPMQGLISHFEIDHLHFQHLGDPLRMVCPVCDSFYTSSTDQCLACFIPSDGLVEKLYGRYFPDVPTTDLHPESGAVRSGPSYFGSSGGHGHSWSPYQGSSAYPRNSGYYHDNFQYGSSGSPGGSYHSNTRSVIAHFKRILFSISILPLCMFRSVIRRRKYITALVIAATVLLVLGYKKHNWVVSNLIQLTPGVTTVSPSKLPAIGVFFASTAFGLHRIIVHATRANDIRNGWLSRCALNVFNVACGRQRPEWPSTLGYELGHSRA